MLRSSRAWIATRWFLLLSLSAALLGTDGGTCVACLCRRLLRLLARTCLTPIIRMPGLRMGA